MRLPQDCPAIYLVEPTPENIDRICADCRGGVYDCMHLNFAAPLSRPLMEKLADEAVVSGSVATIETVYDQYCNFVSLEPTLFSLSQRDAYATLNNPQAQDTAINACIDQIVAGLFSLCVTLKTVPIIRSAPGQASEMIATKLEAKLRDNMQGRNNLFAEALSGVSAISNVRPLLVLFDRNNIDLPIMLQHTYVYQAQIHDLLSMRSNVVTVEPEGGEGRKVFDIDVNDPFFKENGRLPFPEVTENIQTGLAAYSTEVEGITSKTNINVDQFDEAGLDEGLLSLSLSNLLCMENPYSYKTFQ
jgi:hypothetical protein